MTDSYKRLTNDFKSLIDSSRLSHAYLFFGGNESDRETKILFAKSIANFLENKNFEAPSGLLQELLVLQKGETGIIGIDDARSIKNFLYQKPVSSEYRILIIPEAECLTPEAQSAILKIVEEPPEASLIILITKSEDSLFKTLISRLQRVYFGGGTASGKWSELGIWRELSLEDIIENDKVGQFFASLIADLNREPEKNYPKIKEALKRLTLLKQFNLNKRLQLKFLQAFLRSR